MKLGPSTLYWPTTALVAVFFAGPGVALIIGVEHFAEEMGRLGYPSYFLLLLGASKLAAVAVILAPGLRVSKEWAYAGMTFDVVGAIYSHLAIEDPPQTIVLPALIGVLVALSWGLRPAGRKALPLNPIPKRGVT